MLATCFHNDYNHKMKVEIVPFRQLKIKLINRLFKLLWQTVADDFNAHLLLN